MPTVTEALAIAAENFRAGRFEMAEEICRRILAVSPDETAVLELLATAARGRAQHAAAAEHLRRVIALQPESARAHNNLGNALADLGQLDEAIGCYRRALELRPDYAQAWNNLAGALRRQGRLDEALEHFRRAVGLRAEAAPFHNNLGACLADAGRLEEAAAATRRALQLDAAFPGAWSNLGNVLTGLGRLDEALGCYRQALRLAPGFAEVHANLGSALRRQGKLDEAIAAYDEALRLKPDYAVAHNNLAGAWKDLGEIARALDAYRRALALKPDYAEAMSNSLCALRYAPGVGAAALAEAHGEFQRRHAAPLRETWRAHPNERDPQRPLRLGFVSPSFCAGPVGSFLAATLESLDRRRCHAVCYSDGTLSDAVTARFRAAAEEWHAVAGLSDAQLAERVRADRIDVLFDLAGHGPGNRLLAFARRPAPVQITWLDSVGTTGLEAIDYVLADRWQIPPGSEGYYTERVLRMPDGYVAFDPPAEAPPVGPLPCLQRAQVTFASFNNPAKMPAEVMALWARVLQRVPGARLVLKYRALDDPGARRRYAERLAACGLDPARVELRGGSPRGELLSTYNEVDVALEPVSYNGGLTTCEALWMGVPVVTCPGETFARRHALGHLAALGWTETVAGSLDEYVDVAVRLASDRGRLAEIRAGLRPRMSGSPLCDSKRFADNLLGVLRQAWREWVRTG